MLLEELKQEVDFIRTSLDAFLTELKKEKFLNEHAGFSCIIYLKNHAIISIRELMGYYYAHKGLVFELVDTYVETQIGQLKFWYGLLTTAYRIQNAPCLVHACLLIVILL